MKKEYMTPETQCVAVSIENSVLAGSLSVSGTTEDESDLLSREGSSGFGWGDDEE